MRVLRSVLGGCMCVVACVVVLTTLTSTPPAGPAIHSIVSHNLKEELEGKMTCDQRHLESLGFIDEPILYPHHSWDNLSTPVIASAVASGEVWQVEGLLSVAQQMSSNLTVVVYSLDLPSTELEQLENTCNTSCAMVKFDFGAYPSHVRDFRLKAYRPIIIQELLVRTGAVLWLDASVRLLVDTHESGVTSDKIEEWSNVVLKNGGVLTWPLLSVSLLPTAALTHPNMFPFFHTDKHNYDFQQMGDAGTLLVYNNAGVHDYLMKPWVSCALTQNCISPIGAQDTGCRYDKKPLFRYSGCHHYDASAFNVALGVMFSYDTRPYLAASSPFIRVSRKESAEADNLAGEGRTNNSVREIIKRDHIGIFDPDSIGPSLRNSLNNLMPTNKDTIHFDTKEEQDVNFVSNGKVKNLKSPKQTSYNSDSKNEH
ncbi:uncharacterized protein LOC135204034 isoform X1 [Macrobrachium nipponense]|uniref:uncharacterized protein LOC135204034 isoform X1 n=1 Tax=Macrobrachium nipponense TaxID=159736 RepID=UPI0030C7B740